MKNKIQKKDSSLFQQLNNLLLHPITLLTTFLVIFVTLRNQQLYSTNPLGNSLKDFNLNGHFDDLTNLDRFIFDPNNTPMPPFFDLEDYYLPDSPIELDDKPDPAILLTIIDDVGASTFSDESQITSLNIKKFISSGTTIAKGARAYPTCTPSRAAILTGRQPATSQAATGGFPFAAIYPGPPTMIDMLHMRGYYVIQAGKWHLGHAMKAYMPNGKYFGIDYFFGKLQGGGQHKSDKDGCFPLLDGLDMFRLFRNGSEQVVCDRRLVDVHSTDIYADEIIEHIRYVRHTKPNQRIAVLFTPQAAHSPTAESQMNPEDIKTCSFVNNHMARGFCAMVEAVARNHLRILEVLSESVDDVSTKTDVIEAIFSDNGGKPTSGADNCARDSNKQIGSMCSRGGKGSVWDGGMLVPGIFKGPKIPQNKVVETLFHVTDIYPTLKGLLDDYWGINTPAIPKLYGVDQSALILGKNATSNRDKVLAHFDPFQRSWVYISGDYKLMFGATGDGYMYHNDGPHLESDSGFPLIDRVFEYFIESTENSESTISAFLTEILAAFRIVLLDVLTGNDYSNPLLKNTVFSDQLRLYDLKHDPLESTNLVLERKDIVHKLLMEAMEEINTLKPIYNYNGRDTRFSYTMLPNEQGALVHGPWRENMSEAEPIELESFLKRFIQNQIRQYLWDHIPIISSAFGLVFAAGYYVHAAKMQHERKNPYSFFNKITAQATQESQQQLASGEIVRHRNTI